MFINILLILGTLQEQNPTLQHNSFIKLASRTIFYTMSRESTSYKTSQSLENSKEKEEKNI